MRFCLVALSLLVACRAGDADETGVVEPVDTDDPDTDPQDTDTDVVDADLDGSPSGEDCDDDDAARFPGNVEVCDAVDNNCDDVIGTELVTWTSLEGVDVDLTETFAAGRYDAAADYVLSEAGALRICGGTWFVNLDVAADVSIFGFQAPTLDGAGFTPIAVEPSLAVELIGLSITASNAAPPALRREFGVGLDLGDDVTAAVTDVQLSGSAVGVRVGARAMLALTDVQVQENGVGVSASVESAVIDVVDSVFSGNTDGAIDVLGVDLTIDGATFSGNATTGVGGSIAQIGGVLAITGAQFTGEAAVTGGALHLTSVVADVQDTSFTTNSASSSGGAIYLDHGSLMLDGVTFANNSADLGGAIASIGGPSDVVVVAADTTFTGNVAATSGGAVYGDCRSAYTFTAVTFGDGADENTPTDYVANEVDADLDGVVTAVYGSICD